MSSKTFDRDLYNNSSQDFIPVACHYDEHTLLTKNGELLQTIQIDGIDSDKISKDLPHLRKAVRESIHNAIGCQNFAFWIHTIRRKADINDEIGYKGLLSTNIHNMWRDKNNWGNAFVNNLYITIIHKAPELKVKNITSWLHSFSTKTISSFEENFLIKSSKELNNISNLIIDGLNTYNPQKLGIRIEGEECYSDQMFLYRRIMQLNEQACTVPISDISSALASHQYAVGNDKIEVTGDEGKKFAALMSIKEYKETSAEALDHFLQIPVEMIVTEVFYFVDREEVTSVFKDQDYILGISGSSELKKLKGLDVIMDEDSNNANFCQHQISFMLIGEDVKTLDKEVSLASETLSNLGIVHVREDVNLEKTFWAQLPANFSFLARMRPTHFTNTAALASLHNYHIGNQYNAWGKALTLLKTEKDTPYFANFHDNTNIGTTCIFGENKSGKTTLMNFLISEADKYNPTTMHLTDDTNSSLYIKARNGRLIQQDTHIINPFICEDTEANREFIFNFFKVISQHYFNPLAEKELLIFRAVSETIFTLPIEKRKLSNVIQILLTSIDGGKSLKKRLEPYLPKGLYYGVFEKDEPVDLTEGELVAINLQSFDDAAYIKANKPKELKLMEQFEYDLNIMGAVKTAIILSAQNLMNNNITGPKIFAVDNLSEMMNFAYYGSLFPVLAQNMSSINGVFVSSANIDLLHQLYVKEIPQEWISSINTSFILPSEISMTSYDKVLNLTNSELHKLSKLITTSRQFLIKQDGKTIAAELVLDDLPAIARILSSEKEEIDIYKAIVKEHGDEKLDNWLQKLYEELDNVL